MKRKFLIVTICLIVVCVTFSLISGIVSDIKALKLYFEITEQHYEKDASVFENKLGVFDVEEFCTIDISKRFGDVWVINEKSYKEQKTTYARNYDPTVNWKVDLSAFVPCGISGDIQLYSATGKCDNNILVAEDDGELFLLASENVLSPYQYSYTDFNLIEAPQKTIEQIWNDHLTGNYTLRTMIVEDGDDLIYIKMRLKEHPELLYSFFCLEYFGKYHTDLPFDETSNGYYDTSTRLKEGIHKVRNTDFKKRHFG